MARKKKASFLVQLSVIIIGGYFLYSYFTQQPGITPNPASQQSPPAQQGTVTKTPPPYALQPTRNSWPPAAEQSGQVYTDAKRLLTANYYVMLDASGSMADQKCSGNTSKMKVAAQALEKFSQSLPADANFGLAIFNGESIRELIPLGRERKNILQTVSQILPNASTPLASAVQFSYQHILAQGQRQLGYGEYYLVLITDGIADKGQDPGRVIGQILGQSPVEIYTIGFCITEQHSLNQPGRMVYRSANDPGSLEQGLQEVLAESPDFQVSDFSPGQ